jgi:leader peptidase (prepilin peptidase)/N-methyltransferase
MPIDSIEVLIAFLFGLAVGSFLNVCIHRIPLGKSIVSPPSSCPECGEEIKYYDNIPLLSYVILFGKCRHCRTPIPLHYPLVEAVTGLLSAALLMKFDLSAQFFLFFLFSASLVTIAFIDLHHRIIPDILSLSLLILGFIASLFHLIEIPWLDSVVGILGGGGFFYLIAVLFEKLTGREGMGGGDIKMLAMIGAWTGWRALPSIILISSLGGILIGGISLLLARRGMRSKIPFGPFLSLGTLVWLFFGYDLQLWISEIAR